MHTLSAAVVHGGGYVGGELTALLLHHPFLELSLVTSDTFSGQKVWNAHPNLRGQADITFSPTAVEDLLRQDVVFLAGGKDSSLSVVAELVELGFEGALVDLSPDFRYETAADHESWIGTPHQHPGLLPLFAYGLPEIGAPYPDDIRFIANPGCFATAIALAVHPLKHVLRKQANVSITALTGASGSGARPSSRTHFPSREGNLRAYNVFRHRHVGEVYRAIGDRVRVSFVPVSGPWTRGIWGTVQTDLKGVDPKEVDAAFTAAYEAHPFVRLWPDELPELRYSVGTPFCDIGWEIDGDRLVVGFCLDNLLKGAASQAVQNANLLAGMPPETGLLPESDDHTDELKPWFAWV